MWTFYYKSDQILYSHKNRKEHREGKRKVFIEFLSVNTFPSKHEKPAPSIQLPSILMILFYPLYYESRQGQAKGEDFPKMQFLVNAVFSCDLNNHMLEKIIVSMSGRANVLPKLEYIMSNGPQKLCLCTASLIERMRLARNEAF